MNPPALWIAPAASGKTEYVISQAAARARGLTTSPRIVVPTALQARACRRRLARIGAIGVRVLPMFGLAQALLDEAGSDLTLAPDPVLVRLVKGVIESANLDYYGPLRGSPGFIEVVSALFGELESANVPAREFSRAISAMQAGARLHELAALYDAYERRLQDERWVSPAGQVSAALAVLHRHPELARNWPAVFVDGFDHFAPAQIDLLAGLAGRVAELVITLTGDAAGERDPLIFHRFDDTRRRIEQALNVQAHPLPQQRLLPPTLQHLENALLRGEAGQVACGPDLVLVEATDEEEEVRSALRWLKERILEDGVAPGETAVLARDLTPYRDLIAVVAAEYGLPVEIWGGLPLAANPAVSDLLNLLRLLAPETPQAVPASYRTLLDAWRSPYFDWSAATAADDPTPIGITPADVEQMDRIARWGRVTGGWAQWREALQLLAGMSPRDDTLDQENAPPRLVRGPHAQALQAKLDRFLTRLTPPAGRQPVRRFAVWLEEIIGEDATGADGEPAEAASSPSLNMMRRLRDPHVDTELQHRDVAALRNLKDVLRGLVWAAESLGPETLDYEAFLADLAGGAGSAVYTPEPVSQTGRILAADVIQGRGLPLRTVAVLGLAEGRFPAALHEDPFLRDTDRRTLRANDGLPLADSLESAEASFFYETLTRASDRLLLTRPTLAQGGAAWPESPFWREVERLVVRHDSQQERRSDQIAASWSEVMQALAVQNSPQLRSLLERLQPARLRACEHAAGVLMQRRQRHVSIHDGDLAAQKEHLARRFGPRHLWSASRLETYLTCPFQFFVAAVLRLEPRPEPQLGMDSAQSGLLMHTLLRTAYARAEVPGDLTSIFSALEEHAPELFAVAPKQLGFRPSAWWRQTQIGLLEQVRRTIAALDDMSSGWTPACLEREFGEDPDICLLPTENGDEIRLRGRLDRVDTNDRGEARVIDYKSGSTNRYTDRSLQEGRSIQIMLYALAVEHSLRLGRVTDGFYWSLREAKASALRLKAGGENDSDPVALAVLHAQDAVQHIRSGHFQPQPPRDGCPTFCPAAGFCWHYRP